MEFIEVPLEAAGGVFAHTMASHVKEVRCGAHAAGFNTAHSGFGFPRLHTVC